VGTTAHPRRWTEARGRAGYPMIFRRRSDMPGAFIGELGTAIALGAETLAKFGVAAAVQDRRVEGTLLRRLTIAGPTFGSSVSRPQPSWIADHTSASKRGNALAERAPTPRVADRTCRQQA